MAAANSTKKTDILLYTAGTPNGQKISILLEELGVEYRAEHVDISKGAQKEEWFLGVNPNGRIPAIIDKTPSQDGKTREKRVFDGQAILFYLTARYDDECRISYPYDSEKYWEVMQWISWMQSGIGPMQGQANHFFRYAPEKIGYAIDRYQNETKRLYQVLETRLIEQRDQSHTIAGTDATTAGSAEGRSEGNGPWIVGGKFTIADLACFSWINWAEWAGVDVEKFPEIKKWLKKINDRPAVKKGLDVPEPFKMKEKMKSKEGEEEYAEYHSQWVMKGQEEDAKK